MKNIVLIIKANYFPLIYILIRYIIEKCHDQVADPRYRPA